MPRYIVSVRDRKNPRCHRAYYTVARDIVAVYVTQQKNEYMLVTEAEPGTENVPAPVMLGLRAINEKYGEGIITKVSYNPKIKKGAIRTQEGKWVPFRVDSKFVRFLEYRRRIK